MISWWLAIAAASELPIEQGTLVLVRTLAYDRALERRTGPLRIGVVAESADDRQARQAVAALHGLVGVTVAERPLAEPVMLDIDAPGAWPERIAGLDALMLCLSAEPALAALVSAARARDVATLALASSFVGHGAALGVRARESRLEILVDRAAAIEEGARLSPELLELALPVRAP